MTHGTTEIRSALRAGYVLEREFGLALEPG